VSDLAPTTQPDHKSWRTVIVAFGANVLVALAKSAAALITGSASMVAEAAHSWADAGNEVFLLIAEHRSAKAADEPHPLGYGREAYIWSLFAAFGIFTAGAVVSVQHGIQELVHREPARDFGVAYGVLALSAVLEGTSLVQSVAQARKTAHRFRRSTFDFALNGSNPTLRAVIAEDSAAIVGLVIAVLGIAAHQITGNSAFDAVGSLLIGVLLGFVAIVLISRNHRYLVGAAPGDDARLVVGQSIVGHREIERVTYLHLEFVGPGQLYVVAAVDLVGDQREDDVARQLRTLERAIEAGELIQTVVLTLSVSDEPSISFN
jgi:cation diffusion facilitator family transporter